MSDLVLTLPWPPSVNRYWRTFRGRMLISRDGREYRKAVCALLGKRLALPGPLGVEIIAFRPDRRRRDLDNLLKAPLDSLTSAGIWHDDSQIVRLSIRWSQPCDDAAPGGALLVRISSV